MKEKEKENLHADEFVKQERYLFNPHGVTASTVPRAARSQLINSVCDASISRNLS